MVWDHTHNPVLQIEIDKSNESLNPSSPCRFCKEHSDVSHVRLRGRHCTHPLTPSRFLANYQTCNSDYYTSNVNYYTFTVNYYTLTVNYCTCTANIYTFLINYYTLTVNCHTLNVNYHTEGEKPVRF